MPRNDFEHGYELGHAVGYEQGFTVGYDECGAEYTAALTGVIPVWQQPRQAEMEAERVCDHTPCPNRCKRCSRCIHSLAYWGRGRDYLGVEAERALAARGGR